MTVSSQNVYQLFDLNENVYDQRGSQEKTSGQMSKSGHYSAVFGLNCDCDMIQ